MVNLFKTLSLSEGALNRNRLLDKKALAPLTLKNHDVACIYNYTKNNSQLLNKTFYLSVNCLK